MLLYASTIVILPENSTVQAGDDWWYEHDERDVGLNYSFTWDKTKELSNVIFDAYLENELRKGRAYGSKGEKYAKERIMNETMADEIGLWNVHTELITDEAKEEIYDKLDVIDKGLSINGTNITECHISPAWMENGSFTFSDVFNISDPDRLTQNWSHTGLIVKKSPANTWIIHVIKIYIITILVKWALGELYDLESVVKFLMGKLETYYGFNFSRFNETNASDLPWIDEDPECTPNCLYIKENPGFNPDRKLRFWERLRKRISNGSIVPYSNLVTHLSYGVDIIQKIGWFLFRPYCKGEILFDRDPDCYDMNLQKYIALPTIYINGTLGQQIMDSVESSSQRDEFQVDFWVNQSWNDSVDSYNVIGEINGSDTSKTVIISFLYDSWWCQGTADSAIGMSIALTIADYFKKYNITPKYNLKFIAFGGEEYGFLGAYSYEANHPEENIIAVIDINQVGFTQLPPDPRLTFLIFVNNDWYWDRVNAVAEESDYVGRTDNIADFTTYYYPYGAPSNDRPFAENRTNDEILTLCFLKDKFKDPLKRWVLHHRTGLNHTEGDVMKYYNFTEVKVVTDMIWNVTKYLTVDPNCWFNGTASYQAVDTPTDGDFLNDSINVSLSIGTSLPHDLVRVTAKLYDPYYSTPRLIKHTDLIVTSEGLNTTITVTLPPTADDGYYRLQLELYNSTGRINEIIGIEGNNCNDTEASPGWIHLNPRGATQPSIPCTPNEYHDRTTLYVCSNYNYNTSGTDQNDDRIQYQWAWRADKILEKRQQHELIKTLYESGETCIIPHTYWLIGRKTIKVRARDYYGYLYDDSVWSDYGPWTEWSEGLDVTVKLFAGGGLSETPYITQNSFEAAVNQSTQWYGYTYGGVQPYNWTWTIDSSRGMHYQTSYQQNPVFVFNTSGNYTVSFIVKDSDNNSANFSSVLEAVDLLAGFNTSLISIAEPCETVHFSNTSVGVNAIVNLTWDFDDDNVHYNESNICYTSSMNHTFYDIGEYNVTLTVKDNQSLTDVHHQIIKSLFDSDPPEVTYASYDLDEKELEFYVTLGAFVSDNDSGVHNVSVNITNPLKETESYSMET
jgi:hypothetical protein